MNAVLYLLTCGLRLQKFLHHAFQVAIMEVVVASYICGQSLLKDIIASAPAFADKTLWMACVSVLRASTYYIERLGAFLVTRRLHVYFLQYRATL